SLVATASAAALFAACGSAPVPGGTAAGTPSSDRLSSPTATPADPPAATPTTQPAAELPRGGRSVFPAYRLVGYAGYPGSPALGRMGIGKLEDRIAELEPLSARYAAGRRPLPVLELIATVVRAAPGADGMYRTRVSDAVIERHLAAARAAGGYLLLNIQPGRAAFLDEVRALERWLRQPDVGVALDPEWAVGPGQVPGKVFGKVTGAQLDAVAAYLSGVVAQHALPEKVMLYHQLAPQIVANPAGLRAHPGVAAVVSVDGIGTMADKVATWNKIVALTPPHVRRGFKLFYEEDAAEGALMTPEQVLALTPQPEYVLYE
ncbi:MAG: hypothetical protein ACXWYP_09515, partial [Pseudonocardia sp.]